MAVAEKDAVRTYFDQDAAGYVQAYTAPPGTSARGDVFRQRRWMVLDCVRQPVGRVLDVGAGPGVFAAEILRQGGEYWLVDVSFAMVAAGRQQMATHPSAQRVHYHVADVEHLPFRDGQFDTVLCIGVLQYLERPERALRELSRVTHAGGQVILSVLNHDSPLNQLHRGLVATLRAGRKLLQSAGVRVDPDASRLTFRADIPNTSMSLTNLHVLAGAAGLQATRRVSYSVTFPLSIPWLRGPIRLWDRLATRAFEAGRLQGWGRELILQFTRVRGVT